VLELIPIAQQENNNQLSHYLLELLRHMVLDRVAQQKHAVPRYVKQRLDCSKYLIFFLHPTTHSSPCTTILPESPVVGDIDYNGPVYEPQVLLFYPCVNIMLIMTIYLQVQTETSTSTEIVLLATQQDSSCTLSANNVTTMQDTRTSSYVMQSHRRAESPCEFIGDGRADYVMSDANADGRRYLRLYRLNIY